MKKRWIAWILLLAMAVLLLPVSAAAAPTEGTWGAEGCEEDVRWSYADGVLTFYGQGKTEDYYNDEQTPLPWKEWLPQIKKAVIEEGITGIGRQTFHGCEELETAVLPASLAEGENTGLELCPKLREIRLAEGSRNYSVKDNVLYKKDANTLTCYPAGKTDRSYTVENGTEQIADRAFSDNKALEKLVLPEGLRRIGEGAFEQCTSLKDIHIPDSLESVGFLPVAGTAYEQAPEHWKGSLLYLGNWLLWAKNTGEKENIEIRPGTAGIADNALYRYLSDNIISVSIPDSVKYIGESALYGCGASEIQLPKNLVSLGKSVFSNCKKLKRIELPDQLTEVPRYTFFSDTALKEVILPKNLKKIGIQAFGCCSSLKEIHIPAGVTEIEHSAFDGCTALKDIYYDGSRTAWEKMCLNNIF